MPGPSSQCKGVGQPDYALDQLHGDVTCGHFHICLFVCHHVGGQKCTAVIERKVLIASSRGGNTNIHCTSSRDRGQDA